MVRQCWQPLIEKENVDPGFGVYNAIPRVPLCKLGGMLQLPGVTSKSAANGKVFNNILPSQV